MKTEPTFNPAPTRNNPEQPGTEGATAGTCAELPETAAGACSTVLPPLDGPAPEAWPCVVPGELWAPAGASSAEVARRQRVFDAIARSKPKPARKWGHR